MSETIPPDELQDLLSRPDPPRLLDVRRRSDRESDPGMIPGAEWKDPEQAAAWGAALGTGEVIIYCVRGGSVSRAVQEKLRAQDIRVRFVEGGLEAWKRSGGPVQGR